MFRAMRRSKQVLTADVTEAVLARGSNGILACLGDDDYPYAVPLNYVYDDGKIYFHSAKAGHIVDAIARHPKVSFAVVDEDRIVSAEYTSYFRSVVAFGRARVVQGEEWSRAFTLLVEKYSSDQAEADKAREVATCAQALLIAIDIEHLSGKEAKELAAERREQKVNGENVI